jgi:hypothetical protein
MTRLWEKPSVWSAKSKKLFNHRTKMRINHLVLSISLAVLSGCAATGPESVMVEKHKGVTVVHHRRHTSTGAVDRIEAISAGGAYSSAEIKVCDVGRYIDSSGNVHEVHQMYRVVQSERPNLMLPRKTHPTGPRTVFTPPNYTPPPNDQRITDAVAEANKAKEKLEAATREVQSRLQQDNVLRGELQDQIDENQRLRDQLNAGMNTPKHEAPGQSDAEKAAQSSADQLAAWGKQVQQ